ncbi:MAG: hypothetical protein ACRERE_07950 [Candidatus Entotheonellia bacterium]
MAHVNAEAMEKATISGSYFPGRIYRNNKFLFKKGSTVYLLDAPDGKVVFVMQSYTNHWDKTLTVDGLKNLGSKIELPPGWKFRVKTLDRDLTVAPPPPDRMALVMQDNLHNTYQGCGSTMPATTRRRRARAEPGARTTTPASRRARRALPRRPTGCPRPPVGRSTSWCASSGRRNRCSTVATRYRRSGRRHEFAVEGVVHLQLMPKPSSPSSK